MQKLNSIYVVEDDSTSRMMLLDFLEQYKGVTVKGFMTAEACIGAIVFNKETPPELVFMDYYLDASPAGKYQGLAAVEKIKEISPSTRVVMFSSVDTENIMQIAKEKGASDYVVKGPNGFNQLKKIIDSGYSLS